MFQAKTLTALNVSRETNQKLQIYADRLIKWQRAVNLISPKTIPILEERHFLDSAQLLKWMPLKNKTIIDFGSGAGFPGLVLALLGAKNVTLVESDQKKATFLRDVIRHTQAPARVINGRIESIEPFPVDFITARALAPLEDLLNYSKLFHVKHPVHCFFLKGENVGMELTQAQKSWHISYNIYPSITHEKGCILHITDFKET